MDGRRVSLVLRLVQELSIHEQQHKQVKVRKQKKLFMGFDQVALKLDKLLDLSSDAQPCYCIQKEWCRNSYCGNYSAHAQGL